MTKEARGATAALDGFSRGPFHRIVMVESSPIVLISGPVGAGKSTVVRQLVALSKPSVAYLEGDTFWRFIAKSKPADDKMEGRKRNARIVIQAMMAAAVRFARGGYETVLDFTIGPWHLKLLQSALKETSLDYVILYPSEAVCAQRAAARSEGPPAGLCALPRSARRFR